MELNRLLLFVAVISPLLVLARAWRPGPFRSWRMASLIVLTVIGLAWVWFRGFAGYIGGAAWFFLLFLPAIGVRKVAELAAHHRYKSARRLATALQLVHPSAELREQVRMFRALESGPADWSVPVVSASRKDRPRRLSHAPVVAIVLLLNAGVFGLGMSLGDLTNSETLLRLGALDPYSVIVRHEYWRLVTAIFLHAGAAHLFFNLFALYVLGPGFERSIGSLRFAVVYLISGLGSGAGVVALSVLGAIQAAPVVGASGCVMGIVGAWAGFLLRNRHAPRAKERMFNILLIIGIQTVFDITTPQVSTTAHVCGLVTGFFVGLIIAPRAVNASLKR